MTCLRALAAAVGLLVVAVGAMAAPPDAATIMRQMKQAVEPAQSTLRKVTLTVSQQGTTATVQLGEARGKLGDAKHILVAVLTPSDLRGTAFLVREEAAGPNDTTWVYVPAIRRVRTLVSTEAYTAFLNSDFTYSDLAFVSTRATLSLLGEETTGGKHTYLLRAVPNQNWYYSKIETTVAADSYLPIERRYFDPAGALWKVERWEGVSVINGVPTALKVTMEDVQAKSTSTWTVTDLQYGATVPDALLQAPNMPSAAASPVWTALQAPVGK